jgi:transposase
MLLTQIPFRLPGFAIDSVQAQSDVLLVEAHTTSLSACCPQCQQSSTRAHSTYTRRPRDLPVNEVAVRLVLHLRRFFCDNPFCLQRIFAERLPDVVPVHAQRTLRLTQSLRVLGFALGGRAGARTAHKLSLPTSRHTLLRLIRAAPTPPAAPRILGVDDFALRKGRHYGTILVDLEQRRPIHLLQDRSADTLARWLHEHPTVEVIARDRSTEYARGASEGAPQARQVADRWHLLKNQREALERMLTRLHSELARLPLAESDETTAASAPFVGPLRPLSPQQQAAREASRARRFERYQHVQALAQQGVPLLQIAQRLNISRNTARKFATTPLFPERAKLAPQPRMLDRYLPYLQERWAEGCSNASQLWRELQAQGYRGVRKQVARWVQQQRTEHAPTAPKKYGRRPPAINAEMAGGSRGPELAAPTQLTWLLLREDTQLKEGEAATLARLEQHADIVQARSLAHQFQHMVRRHNDEGWEEWLQACAQSGIPELLSFAKGLAQEADSIRAALSERWSTGPVEGQITRLKMLKRQMYGRAKLDLLRQRVLHAA